MARRPEGPGRSFLEHPTVYALSLAGAGTAVSVFASRAARASGLRRLGWIALFALEVVIFIGIALEREDARRSSRSLRTDVVTRAADRSQ
jgi:hypothetical protein